MMLQSENARVPILMVCVCVCVRACVRVCERGNGRSVHYEAL